MSWWLMSSSLSRENARRQNRVRASAFERGNQDLPSAQKRGGDELPPPPASSEEACPRNAPDDVVVLHLFEQADFANGRARHALVLCLEADLFERDNLARLFVARAVLGGREGRARGQWRVERDPGKRRLGTHDDSIGACGDEGSSERERSANLCGSGTGPSAAPCARRARPRARASPPASPCPRTLPAHGVGEGDASRERVDASERVGLALADLFESLVLVEGHSCAL